MEGKRGLKVLDLGIHSTITTHIIDFTKLRTGPSQQVGEEHGGQTRPQGPQPSDVGHGSPNGDGAANGLTSPAAGH